MKFLRGFFLVGHFGFALGGEVDGFFLLGFDEAFFYEHVVDGVRSLSTFIKPVRDAFGVEAERLFGIMRVENTELFEVHAFGVAGFFGNDKAVGGELIFTDALEADGEHTKINALMKNDKISLKKTDLRARSLYYTVKDLSTGVDGTTEAGFWASSLTLTTCEIPSPLMATP